MTDGEAAWDKRMDRMMMMGMLERMSGGTGSGVAMRAAMGGAAAVGGGSGTGVIMEAGMGIRMGVGVCTGRWGEERTSMTDEDWKFCTWQATRKRQCDQQSVEG